MRRVLLTGLLAAVCVVLAAPQEASSRGHRRHRAMHTPVYDCPPPAYHPHPMYMPPARPVVEVGAYDKRGFEPKTINVAPGTTVRWVNHGKGHTVTSRDGLFDSGELSPGETYSVTFLRPGTYYYFCRPHEKMGMVGTVVVGSGGPGGYGGSGSSGY